MPDAKWRAEMDANTLKDAEVIKSSPSRLGAAQTAAKRLVEEERKEANAMSKVAGKRSTDTDTERRRRKPDSNTGDILKGRSY